MRIRLQGSSHAARLLSELNRCRLSRLQCDVVLQVGGRTFPAHRVVLACSCAHFHSLFSQAPRHGSGTATSLSLDFVSPTNFEKVLTFIYTGEIFTDLIDVRVLYELAERLGVRELVQACHATFPDLQSSSLGLGLGLYGSSGGSNRERDLDGEVVMAASMGGLVSASACSPSSAASCSSLSSSAVPTPATPSPLPQGRASRPGHLPHSSASLCLSPKAENSHVDCSGQAADRKSSSSEAMRRSQQAPEQGTTDLSLQLKMEVEEEEEVAALRGGGGGVEARTHQDRRDTVEQTAAVVGGTKAVGGNGVTSSRAAAEAVSFPDSSAQFGGETCAPSSSCGEPLDSLSTGAGGDADTDGGVVATIFEDEEVEEGSRRLRPAGEQAEEEVVEQWRGLAEEIIELSDEEERYLEEAEEDEEVDEDLVFIENGDGGNANGFISISGVVSLAQESDTTAPCKACGQTLPADAAAIRGHAETHLTDTGECRVCGAAFPELSASVTHALSHVGILLFSCDMCQTQFCSQAKLVRHRRVAAARYSLPSAEQVSARTATTEFQCAVCTKHIAKDFKAVREHLLTHVCASSLRCAVCQQPQPSLCSLLWHCLGHLSLAAFSCPVCACGFLERPLLERHMAMHMADTPPSTLSRGGGGSRGSDGVNGLEEDYRCFLCPQSFSSATAFHAHLSAHAGGGDVLPGGGVGVAGGSQAWTLGVRKRKHDTAGPDSLSSSGLSSSSSALDGGGVGGSGLSKHNLGFGLGMMGGMGMGMQDKMLQGALPGFPSGLLHNNSTGAGVGVGLGGISMGDGSSGIAMAPKQKWYRCRYCGKRFAHSGEFTYHLRIHTGEKPYQCKLCLRYFRGRSTIICHLKTHAGALMYRCPVCGQYFSTLKLVSSHMELHKDELPPDFNIEMTFMYNDHSKEPLVPNLDAS